MGLQNVIESQGGVSEVAKKIDIAPQVLLDVLSSEEGTASGYAQYDSSGAWVSVVNSTAKGCEFRPALCR